MSARDVIAVWLIALGTLTLVWVVLAELAYRRAERAKAAAARLTAKRTTLIVAYDQACSPHPLHDDVVWVSTDDPADAWAAIGGSAA
jgi:hypothetical protein